MAMKMLSWSEAGQAKGTYFYNRERNSLYRIIVNADDFGRHELINKAVKIGVESGCLRSATLMPGGIAFDDAVEIAKTHRQLGLGIHFTLVNGNPVLPASEISSLVDRNGKFYDNYGIFVKRYFLGKVRLEEVRAELAAQLTKLKQTGIHLTHCDSHQHIHALPGITPIVCALAKEAGIRAVRIPATGLFLGGSVFGERIAAVVGRAGLRSFAELARCEARRCGLKTTEHFAGNVAGRAVNAADFKRIMSHLQPGITELMMHPGTDNERLQRECQWEHDFEAELRAVSTPTESDIFKAGKIEAISFAGL